ncbi:hypothetical protein GCM10027186_31920 [Micromonospora schwarzwaldensis]
MAAPESDRYRYTARDLERVPPREVRVGDLIAHAGRPGSGLFSVDRVTAVGWAGTDPALKVDTWRIEYRSPWGDLYFVNPDTFPVYRLKVAT